MVNTRDKFISVATVHFAERGFYGTSIADISEQLGLSKQALLHHFGSKEKLYSEVLKQISDDLMKSLNATIARVDDPNKRVEEVFSAILATTSKNREATQLLVRELLDNKRRAEGAQIWHLNSFLELLFEVLQGDQRSKNMSKITALAIIYQILGAMHYFLISGPTLTQIFGNDTYETLEQNYETEIKKLVSARLELFSKMKS